MLTQNAKGRRDYVIIGVMVIFKNRSQRSLDGLWDIVFYHDGNPEDTDLNAMPTDKALVPGCFDVSPALYGRRGTAVYSRDVKTDPVRSR